MIKKIIPTLVFALLLLANFGCTDKQKFPETGDLYFKGIWDGRDEYIHMHFDNKRIDGEILTEQEVAGGVYHRFWGEVSSDSTLQLNIELEYDTTSITWVYKLGRKKLEIKNYWENTAWVIFEKIELAQMPDMNEYASMENVRSELEGGFLENTILGCYESSASSGDSIQVYEYIQFNDRELGGSGYGIQGDSYWHFNFSGEMNQEGSFNMEVNYLQTGKPAFATRETWAIDDLSGELNITTNSGSRPGASLYKSAECATVKYYESVSPNAAKKTPLYEYIKFSYKGQRIWGVGAGDFMEGTEPWTLLFNGTFLNYDHMKLKVRYDQEGKEPFTTEEEWVMDIGNRRLYRPDWKKSDNEMGASEYYNIELDDLQHPTILEQMRNSIHP